MSLDKYKLPNLSDKIAAQVVAPTSKPVVTDADANTETIEVGGGAEEAKPKAKKSRRLNK